MTYTITNRYSFDSTPNDSVGGVNAAWTGTPAYNTTIKYEGTASAGIFSDIAYMTLNQSVLTGKTSGKIGIYVYNDAQSAVYASMLLSYHFSSGNWGYISWNAEDDTIAFAIDGNTITTTDTFLEDTWYLIECTWDGTTQKIYVNDVEKASGPQAGKTFATLDQTIRIGRYGALSNFHLHGYVDDLTFSSYSDVVNVTVTPDVQALSLSLETPVENFDYKHTVSALALSLAQGTSTYAFDFTQAVTALELTLTQGTPNVLYGTIVTPAALELTLAQGTPTYAFDFKHSVSALELTATLNEPTTKWSGSVSPEALNLSLSLKDPIVALITDCTFSADTLNLTLSLPVPLVEILAFFYEATLRFPKTSQEIAFPNANATARFNDISKTLFFPDTSTTLRATKTSATLALKQNQRI